MRIWNVSWICLSAMLLFALGTGFAQEGGIKGWTLAGSAPKSYSVFKDRTERHERHNTIVLRSIENVTDNFGTVMQMVQAKKFRGKRVMLSGYIRAKDVKGDAGLWMRVDGANDVMLAFDNMSSRPIVGTEPWRKYEVVLDVPQVESKDIAFGARLYGSGQLWISGLRLRAVSRAVKCTAPQVADPKRLPEAPVNMDFD